MAAEATRATVASMLKGIDRYNPENIPTFEKYIEIQADENAYDLEANLAVLKLYQLNPHNYSLPIVQLILLKALTNLPHTDFVLCKCLIERGHLQSPELLCILKLHDLLETCQFTKFWEELQPPTEEHKKQASLVQMSSDEIQKPVAKPIYAPVQEVTGFADSIRKFICHVVNITYQHISKGMLCMFLGGISDFHLGLWMNKYGWKDAGNDLIFISNQEENIKTKNITEKIEFESVATIMSASR